MKALGELELFVRAADGGSFSAAARSLELSPAAASAAIKRLEAELQTRLFVRSTRSLRLTPDGERFLAHCRVALQALSEGEQALRGDAQALRGSLQLSLPSDLGRGLVLGWLDEFLLQHPALRLRVQVTDRLADVYRQPVDVALRYGAPADSALVALPLVPQNRRVAVASPGYLAQHGRPAHPQELRDHNCLRFLLSDDVHARWRFHGAAGDTVVAVDGDRTSDDGDAVRRWAIAGRGIAYKSWLDVGGDVAAGRLDVLLPDWRGEAAPLHLVCADRRLLSPAVRALRDLLAARFAALPLPPAQPSVAQSRTARARSP
ncbi:MAG TPA: LysR family transcriptional regulator [Tahibacter sp.]|uniref:LysR family transcriptional regulator n=1 Tax=Tahibacter sp. TaxID=2056211 RepID=UPI002B6FBFBC|nr:LysR family transcriptional regulator [Tahibacter sp.]HSX58654.1 LysR family transcriptional regulator [Tahibacter sp.]